MKSVTTQRFRDAFKQLPKQVQRSGKRAYRRFQRDPSHPALHFKRIHAGRDIYSVRVSLGYRALGTIQGDELVWFWIGTHADYDHLVAKLRRG